MKIKNKSRIIVFILSFLVWIALTSLQRVQELLIGLILSLLISWIAGQFLVTSEKSGNPVSRLISFVRYLFRFLWELIKANIHVAYIVAHPKLPVRPGIVKVKTELKKDSARTMLCNSITLTPGTMTVDINPEKNEIYIHWIDIVSKEPKNMEENTRVISDKFETILKEIFE